MNMPVNFNREKLLRKIHRDEFIVGNNVSAKYFFNYL